MAIGARLRRAAPPAPTAPPARRRGEDCGFSIESTDDAPGDWALVRETEFRDGCPSEGRQRAGVTDMAERGQERWQHSPA